MRAQTNTLMWPMCLLRINIRPIVLGYICLGSQLQAGYCEKANPASSAASKVSEQFHSGLGLGNGVERDKDNEEESCQGQCSSAQLQRVLLLRLTEWR